MLPLLPCTVLFAVSAPQDPAPAPDALFRDRVAPLLEAHCLECHGSGERLRGDLWLTRRASLLEGGASGPAVDLANPESSLLLAKVSYRDEQHQMPPKGRLSEAELATLADWVDQGAPWDPSVIFPETAVQGPERLTKGDGQEGWAYVPPRRPAVPSVAQEGWVRTPVDAFLLARMEAAGLSPTQDVGREAWLRRVTFNLIGLPPTPQELADFLADTEGAEERVVERLLASPHYGERWGRHWLDVVRYAETNGFERDGNKPEIWRYRDWVVQAFNEDLPYDQFVRMQLAGDEFDEPSHDDLIATGFLRLMQWDDEPPEGPVQARYDVLDDIVRTTSEGFLATTLGCARCHDHKGDPVDQTDYYSFMSFFEGLSNYRTEGWLVPILTAEEERQHAADLESHKVELAARTQELQDLEERFRQAFAAQGQGSRRSLLSDLTYRFYRDDFRRLADFDGLRHEDEGTLEGGLFDLSPATRNENYGFVFEGRLRVPSSGLWDIQLDSDDGARLVIDGRTAIEYDRTGPLGSPQNARVELQAGVHPVRLDFFQWVGGAALRLSMAPAAANRWEWTFTQPASGWETASFDAAGWSQGPGGFGTAGTPGAVIGTEWSSSDIWARHAFEWDPADQPDPVLIAHYDDDLQLYVNGVLALETTGYITGYRVFELSDAARRALVPGTNVLALHCEQDFGGQYVHARVAPRSDTLAGQLADAAFGRYQLSASQEPDGGDLGRRIATSGAGVLSSEEVERHKQLQQRVRRMVAQPPRPPRMANVATEPSPRPPLMRVHVRGSALAQGDEVPVAFPTCMDPTPVQIPEPATNARSSGRRRALADWIASPGNPLTARVLVNRVWQQHFGVGLVPTPNDFGELGERPSHPELLDWLATEFMAMGWSIKDLHRLLLSSSAYRMDSSTDEAGLAADPTNRLLWHFRPRRLTAEELRDSVLWLTGRLNPALGGPSIFSMMPEQARATASNPGASWGQSTPEELRRRSLYIKAKRSMLTPLLTAFDLADTDSSCPTRYVTTSPSQALGLLNGEFAQLRASEFAERIAREAPEDREAQVGLALQLALGREPEEADQSNALALWQELVDSHGLSQDQARSQVCLYVLNLSEFVYLD